MLFLNIQPNTMSYTPDNDITGFIIPLLLFLFIISILFIGVIESVYNKVKTKVKAVSKRIKQRKAQKKYNTFYKSIIDNKILLSAHELQTIKNNYMNI